MYTLTHSNHRYFIDLPAISGYTTHLWDSFRQLLLFRYLSADFTELLTLQCLPHFHASRSIKETLTRAFTLSYDYSRISSSPTRTNFITINNDSVEMCQSFSDWNVSHLLWDQVITMEQLHCIMVVLQHMAGLLPAPEPPTTQKHLSFVWA